MSFLKKVKNIVNDVTDISTKASGSVIDTTKGMADSISETFTTVTNIPSDISYIKKKNIEIEKLIKETNEQIEPMREQANLKLEELGKVKVEIISTILDEFSTSMHKINNLPFESDVNTSATQNDFNLSKQELDDMKVSIISVKDILKNTTGAGVIGAVGAGTAYSAVAALGAASTGTLISSISGAAATNATLAWLGGGALAAGGGGIALGTIVLGGIGVIPAVSYLAWKGNLDYTKKKEIVDQNYREAFAYSQTKDSVIKNLTELIRLINNTIILVNKYSIECNKLNKQTDHIIQQLGTDYSRYDDKAKALIQKHVTYTKGLSELFNASVIHEDGSVNSKMAETLRDTNAFLNAQPQLEFVSFKKKSVSKIYLITILLVSILIYTLYQSNTDMDNVSAINTER